MGSSTPSATAFLSRKRSPGSRRRRTSCLLVAGLLWLASSRICRNSWDSDVHAGGGGERVYNGGPRPYGDLRLSRWGLTGLGMCARAQVRRRYGSVLL